MNLMPSRWRGSAVPPWTSGRFAQLSGRLPKGSNRVGFRNAEADKIIEALETEFDEGRRKELAHQFHRLLYDEQPYTFFYTRKSVVFWQKELKNVWFQLVRPHVNHRPFYLEGQTAVLNYVIKRLFLMVPTFAAISLVIFVVLNFAPGTPGGTMATGEAGGQDASTAGEQRESYRISRSSSISTSPCCSTRGTTSDAPRLRKSWRPS